MKKFVCVEDLIDFIKGDDGYFWSYGIEDEKVLEAFIQDGIDKRKVRVLYRYEESDKQIGHQSIKKWVRKIEEVLKEMQENSSDCYANYVNYVNYVNYSDSRYNRWNDPITFDTQAEAEQVLRELRDKINRTGIATVADYYTFSNQKVYPTYYNWGWTKLDQVTIYSYGSSGIRRYALKLPDPLSIKNY